jgi:hypothetical protein
LYLKDNITLREERGNAFIAFLKEGRKGDCRNAINSLNFLELWWKLYQRAKQDAVKASGRR